MGSHRIRNRRSPAAAVRCLVGIGLLGAALSHPAFAASDTDAKLSLDLRQWLAANAPQTGTAPATGSAFAATASSVSTNAVTVTSNPIAGILIRTAVDLGASANQLHFQGCGATIAGYFTSVNTFAAVATAQQIQTLAADPAVLSISMDRPTASASTLDVNPATVGVSEAASVAASLGAPGGWFGPDGSGVGVAVLDSGAALMPDIALRIAAFKDFVGSYSFLPYDDYGHGTHVAGIVAGSGLMSSSLIATRTYRGIAPGSSLIIGKVLDGQGRGTVSNAIAGIDWCIAHKAQYNIRVINLSLGSAVLESYKTDPLCQAAEKAVAAGIVVVVAAGNNQLYGSICSPGNDPAVITVGAVGTNGTAAHVDDSIAWYSSRGPSLFDASLKPDIVAPGTQVVSVRAPGSWIDVNHPETNVATSAYLAFPLGPTAYTRLTGTSMAAPAVAGAAAVLLQVNPLLTPSGVKAALMLSAGMLSGTDLLTGSAGIFDPFTQGAGELDLPGAVELAYRIRPVVGISGSPSMASTIGGRTFSWSLATLPGLWSLSGSPATLLNGGAATWASALWSGAWSDALIWGGPVSFSLQNGVVYAGNLTWGGGNRVPDGGTAWASNLTWGGGSRVNPNPYTDATNMTWGGGSVNRVQDPTGGLNLTWGGGGPN